MRKHPLAMLLLVLCLLVSLAPMTVLAADASTPAFSDVAADAWYANQVTWAVNGGITAGVGDDLFGPEWSCTRAQAVTFLYKAMGSPAVESTENPFGDTAEGDWYYTPVLWAVENGITAGVTADTFGVNNTCTREQFVTFLYKAVGSPAVEGVPNQFIDVADDAWYTAPILWAYDNGISTGKEWYVGSPATALFGVGDTLTRAEVVTFLYANENKPAMVHNYADLVAAVNDTEPEIKLAKDFSTEGEETAALVINYPVVLNGNGASIDFGFEVTTGGVTIKNFNINTSVWGKAVSKNGKADAEGNMTKGDCIAIEIHNTTDVPVIVENNNIVHDVFLNNNSSVYLADGTLAHILNNSIKTENKSGASYERGGIYIGIGARGKIVGNTIDSAKTAMPMSPLGLTENLDKMTGEVAMPEIEIKDNVCSSIYVTKMYTNGVLFGEDGYIKDDDTDYGAREALEGFIAALAADNTFRVKADGLAEDENVFVVSRLDLIYAGTPLKQASNYFEVVDGKLVEKPADQETTVSNYAELVDALNGSAKAITLTKDFSTAGENALAIVIDRPVVLDGNDATITFGFEVTTGGVTIKNFNIRTSVWGKAVSKNGKADAEGNMTKGDCIAIEIHNATDVPVVIENNNIVHDVFRNNNSSIYLADGTLAHVLNNNIKTENKSNASYERGGIYVGSGTRGKIVGNTIDSAKTAMPMSPLGLTENLDKMTGEVAMPEIEIKDNVCSSIYVTKMYTNGVLFGEDGCIKADDTDYGAREALEGFMAALAANNTFTNKPGTLAADENVYVVSRLDLIYQGVSLKNASNYFEVVDGKIVESPIKVHNYAGLKAALAGPAKTIILADDFSTESEETAAVVVERAVVLDGNNATIDFGFEVTTGGVTIKNFNINTSVWGKAVSKNGKDDGNGNMTKGDCIAIEIHNTTDVPVIVENNNIVHDVFLNNNSSVYLADGTLAHVLNNNIKTENKSNASYERGGIYVGSGTRGKIVGNTIDSAKTAMPMSPLGLTENLDKMTGEVAMPAIEIKDNVCSSIYVTKMYTNGVLFGEDGCIKDDDTDYGAREALEGFLAALDANNSFSNKPGTLAADENVYVVSRLDLIYQGTPLKQASNYFEIVDGKLVEQPAALEPIPYA